jgi:hypothetical protein
VRKRTETCRLTAGGGLEEDLITLLSHDTRRSGQCGTALTRRDWHTLSTHLRAKRCRNRQQTNVHLRPTPIILHLILIRTCAHRQTRSRGATTKRRLVVLAPTAMRNRRPEEPRPAGQTTGSAELARGDVPNNSGANRELVE